MCETSGLSNTPMKSWLSLFVLVIHSLKCDLSFQAKGFFGEEKGFGVLIGVPWWLLRVMRPTPPPLPLSPQHTHLCTPGVPELSQRPHTQKPASCYDLSEMRKWGSVCLQVAEPRPSLCNFWVMNQGPSLYQPGAPCSQEWHLIAV